MVKLLKNGQNFAKLVNITHFCYFFELFAAFFVCRDFCAFLMQTTFVHTTARFDGFTTRTTDFTTATTRFATRFTADTTWVTLFIVDFMLLFSKGLCCG